MSTHPYSLTINFPLSDNWFEIECRIADIVSDGVDIIYDGGGTDFATRDVEFFTKTVELARNAVARLKSELNLLSFHWDIGEFYDSTEFEDGLDWRELEKGEVSA